MQAPWGFDPLITLHGQRILFVEDDAILAMLIEDSLLRAGATIIGPAATVEQALRLIDTAPVNGGLAAAVLDVGRDAEAALPVADKLAAFGVPFLLIIGYGATQNWGQHRSAPMLIKPFPPENLIAAVGALCGLRGLFG